MRNLDRYVYSKAEGEVREEAISLHYNRYKELGFFKNNEIDEYEPYSTYFVAETQEKDQVVGVTRLVFMDLMSLPTIKNFEINDISLQKLRNFEKNTLAELSALTKAPQHDVGLGLIRSAVQYSLEANIECWVCCIDERVFNYLNRIFKFPFQIIGEPKIYLGSKTIPCIFNLTEGLPLLKEKKYSIYEFLVTPQAQLMEVK
ncbi:N-acyl amino acid synthase FeeM domain-containing protein [Halalkalibacter urbisdiaboli]|uniref:N-acyl amino acid synthase FeeM domain-containing protein n=1 Tax=Halalkalibacter urbisdiaboli TaxID=1960589 RepID=UPI000B451946|nr:hypothetical protein [Halalkalibacter urbisdiaboli]